MKKPRATHDEEIKVRLPSWLKQQAEAIAHSEDMSVARLARKALQDYFTRRQTALQAHGV